MNRIIDLHLNAFRNYTAQHFSELDHQFVILVAANGAGKTNCLEAISLLSPGRGLRGASLADCQNRTAQNVGWTISADIFDDEGDRIHLGVGRDPQNPDKKIIRADGHPVKNQEELGDILRTIWLTPQMDGLFLQSATDRRRFFDRLVATYDAGHTGRMTRYEKSMSERLSLLKQAEEKQIIPDEFWLDGLEQIMAETSIAIAASRLEVTERLQSVIDHAPSDIFPQPVLSLVGDIEQTLSHHSAVATEDAARDRLRALRRHDGLSGRTHYGVHKTDFQVFDRAQSMDAAHCSTGEQKALLTGIILAHSQLVTGRYGKPPLLLFDEITAHFDERRRNALFDILSDLQTQVWLTGQETAAFQTIKDKRILAL